MLLRQGGRLLQKPRGQTAWHLLWWTTKGPLRCFSQWRCWLPSLSSGPGIHMVVGESQGLQVFSDFHTGPWVTKVPSFFCYRNNNIDFLMEHKKILKNNCEREEEKAAELELRSRLFSFGEFNSDAQVHSWPVVTLPPGNNLASLCTEHLMGELRQSTNADRNGKPTWNYCANMNQFPR